MMDKFNEFYMMQNQAKKLEQSGMDDKALELYLKIISDYLPNNDFSFDRAATLLEKKSKYIDAIMICEKAITLISANDIQGDASKFKQKIERLQNKAKNDSDFQAAVNTKEPEVFHFGLPGFRSHRKLLMAIGTGYYGLAAIAAYPDQLFTFICLFGIAFVGSYGFETFMKLAEHKTCTKALAVTLIALVISGYSMLQIPQVKVYWDINSTQVSDAANDKAGEGDQESDNGSAGSAEDPDTDRTPPEIPDKYLESAAKAAEKDPATEYADVSAENGVVTMSLIVKPGTSQDIIAKTADDMVRTLGGLMTSEGLKGPAAKSYGELYTFYSVTIDVTDTMEQDISSGVLLKNANEIAWEKP